MLSNIIRLSKPLTLLLASLTYLLGASIPAYLGEPVQATVFTLGLLVALLTQASMNLLTEVFRPYNEPLIENVTPLQIETLRKTMLYISIGMLGTVAFLTYLLYLNLVLTSFSFVFILLSVLLALIHSIYPFRFVNRGFGELTLAVQIAYLIPSIGFLLQAGEPHRLLTILIVPITSLALAYFLVLNFPSFADDTKYERNTLLRRLTWEHAVPLHHILILFSYFIFALAPLFGFSFNLIWPAFLTLPFAIFQIIQVRAIANGNSPNWRLLTSTALAVFGLTTYFLTLTFWLR